MRNIEVRPMLRCKRCGCPSVRWMQTRAGKWYLAVRVFDAINPAYAGAMVKVPHKCDAHARHSIELEEHQAGFYHYQETHR